MQNDIIFIKDSLVIETNIIGYKNQGEAILFFIKVDNYIRYSGLIDCFSNNSINVVDDLLEKNNIKKLNFICWTHPDSDHSNGFDIIFKKYVDDNTMVWIPESAIMNDKNCSNGAQKVFSELQESLKSRNPKYNVYTASDNKDLLYYAKMLKFRKNHKDYTIKIDSYTPNSHLLNKNYMNNNFIKNDCSILLSVRIGNIIELFTSDVENNTLQSLPQGLYFDNLHIIKIPHHGSNTSDFMLKIFGNCQIACSTVYRIGSVNLPLANILDEYAKVSEDLYCTGNLDSAKEHNCYGIVTIETDVINEAYEVRLNGNASSYEQFSLGCP